VNRVHHAKNTEPNRIDLHAGDHPEGLTEVHHQLIARHIEEPLIDLSQETFHLQACNNQLCRIVVVSNFTRHLAHIRNLARECIHSCARCLRND